MDQQQVDHELGHPGAQELLASTSGAHLAYTAPDGTPRVVPVGYYWTGTEFAVSTAATAPKVAMLRAHPDVALAIDSGDTPGSARALSIRGRAEISLVDGIVPEYLAAARKSMGEEDAAAFEEGVRSMYDQMARIAVVPRWARFYDYDAGRLPGFLQELADRSGDQG